MQKRGCLDCSSLHLFSSDRICYGALVIYIAAALFGACRNIYVSSVQYKIKILHQQVAYHSADCSSDRILCSNCSSPPSIWSLIQLQQTLILQSSYWIPCLYAQTRKDINYRLMKLLTEACSLKIQNQTITRCDLRTKLLYKLYYYFTLQLSML